MRSKRIYDLGGVVYGLSLLVVTADVDSGF